MPENKVNETTERKEKSKSSKERLKDITDSIETGIKELFESDKYKNYLQTMSRFHRYSVNNQMLIYMQKPDATLVAGFNKWHDQFERNVKKGEKGIKIIAPTPFKKKIEETKLDPDTKLPILDDNGNEIKVEKEIKIPMFRVVSVFDVSQTDGKPLPQLANDLSGNVQNYEVFLEAIKRSSAVPISFESIDRADGYFSLDEQKIVIRDNMSEVQTISALLHELAHSKLHNKAIQDDKLQEVTIFGNKALFSNERIDKSMLPQGLYCYDLRGSDDDPGIPITVEEQVAVNHAGSIVTATPLDFNEEKHMPINDDLNFLGTEKGICEFWREQYPDKAKNIRNTEEVQAESISFAVCAYYGLKTEENSFGYIASWSKGKELAELKESLETINKASNEMITEIDKNYADIIKERGVEKNEPELSEALYENSLNYLYIQLSSDNAWDYSIYDKETLNLVDGGRIDDANMKLEQVKEAVMLGYEVKLPYGEMLADSEKSRILDHIADKAVVEMTACLPDPSITIPDMHAYGYHYENMLPLSKETAQRVFDMDANVYMLHYDDTESMVLDANEIKNFDGIFGIEKQDWEAVKDNYLKNVEMSVEDDYNMIDGIINNGDNKPTVEELENDVKNGKEISLSDLADALKKEKKQEKTTAEKPSLLAKLNNPLPSKQEKTIQSNNEREM